MILSVSRRTDIPNYYSDWFVNRIKEGFLYVRNPMNAHQISKIDLSPDVVDCIVFWTKNPANMLEKLEYLKDYIYYFQFTLTGYGKDIEPNLPDKRKELIPTFKEIANSLADYTERVVISFVDLYTKTQRNTKKLDIRQMTSDEMISMAAQMAQIASKYNLVVESCAEQIDLQKVGVQHGSCIDKKLVEKILGCKLIVEKDKNQREACGCFESVEVGAYNTCLNGCKYCYANFNDEKVKENVRLYNQTSPLLCGNINLEDKITDRKVKSFKDAQLSFFEY